MLLPGHARPPPAPQPAQHPGLRRQVEPPGQLLRLFYCTVLVCSKEISALTDFSESCEEWTFPDGIGPSVGCGEEWICRDHRSLRTTGGSGYLTKLLQNHTAYACDGDHLNLQCPRHSTISVQSAFYGQDYQMCSTQQPASQREDSLTCVAPTTLQKVLDECQNQRACHLLVNSRVFGPDLCPGSSKYLLVSFKCQPNELKNKTVCENQELKLHCHPSKFLNIYSASYGRRTQEPDICFSEAERLPPFVASHRVGTERRLYAGPRSGCGGVIGDQHRVHVALTFQQWTKRLSVLLSFASVIQEVLREAEMQNHRQQSPFREPVSARSAKIPLRHLCLCPPRESSPAVRVQCLHRSCTHIVRPGHQGVLHQGLQGAAAGEGAPRARK
ncbi:protein eva-1 homolog C isoform X5 [Panthera onca]|uniref:protein eva-1 homolog C isoform X5 n=1 Tax=Panthera onca TaxID=9690 RepID=UPI0029548ED3|nr:protein eva-1 homolog C isoform X5 [Panthera onca]